MLKRLPLLVLVCFLVLTGCKTYRSVVLFLPNCKDSEKRFPSAPVKASEEPFSFKEAENLSTLGDSILVFEDKRGGTYCNLEEFLDKSPTRAFLIIRKDSILYEWYDDKVKEEDYFASFSLAKSFLGSLFGIAIQEGHINSVNDPITQYLPELDPQFEAVSIQHLLNHTSGIEFPGEAYTYYAKSLSEIHRKVKLVHKPGSTFVYSNGGSQLLTHLLARAVGKPLNEYMEEKIWQPIGANQGAYWSVDNKKDKNIKGFCCMNAQARDYAKMGKLLINQGNWEGEQLIPEDWIENTLNPANRTGQAQRYRNHLWFEGIDTGIYFAAGLFGQYLYMYPKKDIVIVKLSKFNFKGSHADWAEFFSQVLDQL